MTQTAGPIALKALAEAAGDLLIAVTGDPATKVSSLSLRAAEVQPGGLFFCIPGTVRDGHEFAPEAQARGAVALVVERPTGTGLPELLANDPRRAMGRISAAFHGYPAADLELLGVTGTNGKTTTVFLLDSILRAAGHRTGLIGTIETRIAGTTRPGVRTTPDSPDLQSLLAEMRGAGVNAVAMEITSHALVLHRVEGLRFTAAAFTNLSQDHLDFHQGMEDYFAAKRSLFTPERTDRGAVNVDDPYGRRLLDVPVEVLGFGSAPDAEVRAETINLGPTSTDFVIATPSGEMKVSSKLIGAFNVSNCLAAAATSLQAGIDPGAIEEGLNSLEAVPGRFESIDSGQPFAVVVDYAHTPDSLDNVLRAARRMVEADRGRVICAFGGGGDRDHGKRPLMGAVVARLADVVAVTSDNPRSEDPNAIIEAILEGVVTERAAGADLVDADRRSVIFECVARARAGDIVVIAGKGHETGQEFADHTIPFDDRAVARQALTAVGWGRAHP